MSLPVVSLTTSCQLSRLWSEEVRLADEKTHTIGDQKSGVRQTALQLTPLFKLKVKTGLHEDRAA